MKVIPVSSPVAIQPQAPSPAAATDAKARAIAILQGSKAAPTQGNAQETAVANPNNISAEELSAVKAPSQEPQVEAQAEGGEVEAAPEAPAEEKKPETKASQEWAKLARQERLLRQKAQEQEAKFRQREEAIKAREAEAQQKSEINQKGFISLDKLKNDPLTVLAEAGVSYDQIADQIINPTKVDPRLQATIDKLQAKIEELEKGTTEANERMTKQQQDAYNQAVRQIELDTKNLVASDPNFETIKATRSEKDVVELITKTWEKDQILLTVEEAAQEVENYLIDEAMKLTRIEKIKRKLTPTQAAAQKPAQPAATKGQDSAPLKTLTNTVSSTRKLSARERAILAMRGELK